MTKGPCPTGKHGGCFSDGKLAQDRPIFLVVIFLVKILAPHISFVLTATNKSGQFDLKGDMFIFFPRKLLIFCHTINYILFHFYVPIILRNMVFTY